MEVTLGHGQGRWSSSSTTHYLQHLSNVAHEKSEMKIRWTTSNISEELVLQVTRMEMGALALPGLLTASAEVMPAVLIAFVLLLTHEKDEEKEASGVLI